LPIFVDQLGRSVSLHTTPKRIVSLVPSQTELLHYLGGCACFALGVPDAVQIGQTKHHPQKRPIPRQAG